MGTKGVKGGVAGLASGVKSGLQWYKKWRWDDKTRLATRVALRVRRDALLQLSDTGLALLAKTMNEPRLRRTFMADGEEETPTSDQLTKEREIAYVIQKTLTHFPRLSDFKTKDQVVLRGIFYECATDVPKAAIQPMFFNNTCQCVALKPQGTNAVVYVLPDDAAQTAFLIRQKEYGYDPELGECTPYTHKNLIHDA